jgi:2-desacetyl-2-hydroxyethyl bacteriochlorophyllide A dehydrogenase
MTRTATRVVFPEIKRTEWERVSLPDTLEPTEVLVKAVRTLVSAGTEIAIYSGTHINSGVPGARYPRYPFYPGYAFAGTVEAIGAEVTGFEPGDRVAGSMHHQDLVVVDLGPPGSAGQDALERIPDGVSFEQACLARLSMISMQGVRLSRLVLGERVAVFGQGLIGQFARQLAGISGAATIIAVDLIDARLEVARRHGATHLVNPSRVDLATAIAEATEGKGVDVAIEATGNPTVTNDALKSAARLGRVILLGSPRGTLEIDIYRDVHGKGVSIIGAHANTTPAVPNGFHPWTVAEHRRLAMELIRQGRLRTDGLVTHHRPAAEALPIWDALMTDQQAYLGVIIDWD